MTRTYLLAAALALGLAVPALADTPTNGNPFTMEDARRHLQQQGYTGVSPLIKDAHGNWSGTAKKDGDTVQVSVSVKGGKSN